MEINRALKNREEDVVLQLMEMKICVPASSALDIQMVLSQSSLMIN